MGTKRSVIAFLVRLLGIGAFASGCTYPTTILTSGDGGAGRGGGIAGLDEEVSPSSVKSCAYYKQSNLACRGFSGVRKSSDFASCLENETACSSRAPASGQRETSDCFENWTYSAHDFTGTCADHAKYRRGEYACVSDKNCSGKDPKCVAHVCTCGGQPCPEPTAPTPGPDAKDAGARADAGSSGPPGPPTPP